MKINLIIKWVLISFCLLITSSLIAFESKTIVYKGKTFKLDKLAEFDIDTIIRRDTLKIDDSGWLADLHSYFIIERIDSLFIGFLTNIRPKVIILDTYGNTIKTGSYVIKNSPVRCINNNVSFLTNGKSDTGFLIKKDLNMNMIDDFNLHFSEVNQICAKYQCPPIDPSTFFRKGYHEISDSVAYLSFDDRNLLKINIKNESFSMINLDSLYEFAEKNNIYFDQYQIVGIVHDNIVTVDSWRLNAYFYNIHTKKTSCFWTQMIPNNFSIGELYRPMLDFSSFNFFVTNNHLYCIVEGKHKINLFRIELSS